MKPDTFTNLQKDISLKETTLHGDILFPLQRYEVTFQPLSPELPIHWHNEMEFTRIISGEAVYSIDFQEYKVTEGDLICVQPNLLHTARILTAAPKRLDYKSAQMTSDTFVFHLNLLGNSSADICSLHYFAPIMEGTLKFPHVIRKNTAKHEELSELFSSLSTAYDQKLPGFELEVKSLLFRLIQLLVTHNETRHEKPSNIHNERLKIIFDYIHTHYTENIAVNDLADLCSITPSHFMHYFKEKSGTTLNQYLIQYRIRQSALLLRQGVSITEAAYSCGFNNLSYFYRRFKQLYQITPKDYVGDRSQ